MLKKILLSLLLAAIALPQPATALILSSGTSQARGMVALQNSLSVSDRQAIKQLLNKMVKAANSANAKDLLATYSPKYQDSSGTANYKTLKSNIRLGLAFMKAYGIQINVENIKITSINSNQAMVHVNYKLDVDPEVLAEMNEQQRLSSEKLVKSKLSYTVEKSNGRWLIVSMQDRERTAGTTAAQPELPTAPVKNQQQERKVLQALFKKHLQALNKEDLKSYLATLDSESAQYSQAQQQTQKLFKEYDLKYESQTIEVMSIGQKDAVVKLVATVKKIKGGSFANSKMVTYNTIRKTANGWRIADTQVESITAL
jgi:ketosteroid isomerase-like protein